ncbi:MAG: M6 family metalloprotease domain-containing protein [Acidobacteriota bacterium]
MSVIFGEILTFIQEKGSEVKLKVSGDEFCARYEDPAGYTAVYDYSLGEFCYARLEGTRLRSTGVSLDQPSPAGLVRHLQESEAMRSARTEGRRLAGLPPGAASADTVVRTLGPNQGLLEGRQLSTGQVRGLTILVEFQDVATSVTAADVSEMLNGDNYTGNGNICSVREYYRRVSSGKLDYANVVVGPYRLSRNLHYYAQNLLVGEALQLAVAAGIDLTQFDSRQEGIIDALSIMYAGRTQYLGELWPHNSFLGLQVGNLRTELYMLTSLGRTAADLSIGTFCHESGHLLCRFPDLYDYGQRDGDNVRSAGIGVYCLMGSGNHLDSGRSPSPVCGYLRDLAGWCDNVIDLNAPRECEARHGDYATLIRYPTSKPNEYFVVENRAKMDLDRGLPASGLAIYHCDIFGSNEWQEGSARRHYQCALLQADGHRDLEMNGNLGDGSDLFGAVQGLALSSESTPNTREWDGRESGLVISDIEAPDPVIKFKAGQAAASRSVAAEAAPMLAIPDNSPAGVASTLAIAASGIVSRIKVDVEITHTYVGDLRVELLSPSGRRALLHARRGGAQDDLIASYDSASPGGLRSMAGQPMQGNWTLRVSDLEAADTGTLRKWRIEITSAAVGVAPPPATTATG